MNIGVLSVDPGGKTGVAWGIFNPLVSPWDALRTQMLTGSITVEGAPRNQITEVATLWSSFFNTAVNNARLPPDRVFLVVEDFIYSGANTYSGDSGMISTAIIWGIEGYRLGRRDEWLSRPGPKARRKAEMPPMILQTASQAKSFATAKRFRDEGLWVRGWAGKDEHIFSAWQHIVFFLQRYRSATHK